MIWDFELRLSTLVPRPHLDERVMNRAVLLVETSTALRHTAGFKKCKYKNVLFEMSSNCNIYSINRLMTS